MLRPSTELRKSSPAWARGLKHEGGIPIEDTNFYTTDERYNVDNMTSESGSD